MIIRFESHVLADHDSAPAFDIRVNGDMLVESVDVIRSVSKRFYPRGNKSTSLQFSVTRTFDSLAAAEVYMLTHWSLRPRSGTCIIECGSATVTMANAVLSATPSNTQSGLAVTSSFTIVAPLATSDTPPDLTIETASTMIIRANTPIPVGAESLTVTFSTPFSSKPVVSPAVAKPSAGGPSIFCTLVDSLTTLNGFTVELSAPVPTTGFVLNWSAVL